MINYGINTGASIEEILGITEPAYDTLDEGEKYIFHFDVKEVKSILKIQRRPSFTRIIVSAPIMLFLMIFAAVADMSSLLCGFLIGIALCIIIIGIRLFLVYTVSGIIMSIVLCIYGSFFIFNDMNNTLSGFKKELGIEIPEHSGMEMSTANAKDPDTMSDKMLDLCSFFRGVLYRRAETFLTIKNGHILGRFSQNDVSVFMFIKCLESRSKAFFALETA